MGACMTSDTGHGKIAFVIDSMFGPAALRLGLRGSASLVEEGRMSYAVLMEDDV